ncbi:MAG: hypothetical protein MI922_16905 [Bacteroidales bacterium]|nr:hypothetical protein [Bacteroidales bacterium]
MSLAREQEESENNENGNEDDMMESDEGDKGTDKRVNECGVENKQSDTLHVLSGTKFP